MADINPWNDVLGPFYAETGLRCRGIEESDDLIGLSTSDGATIFPHAQFDVLPDQKLQRREKVLDLWNTLIKPAIDEGIVDEWTASGLLLQGTKQHPSEADVIAKDETQAERVAIKISAALARFRQ